MARLGFWSRSQPFARSFAHLPLLQFVTGITSAWFVLDSMLPALYQLRRAQRFNAEPTNANARQLFFATLRYLPLVMLLFLLHSVHAPHRTRDQQDEDEAEEDGQGGADPVVAAAAER